MAATKSADVEIRGLNAVLRALNKFPPDAKNELRDAAQRIADRIMAPAYVAAARNVPIYGPALATGIRAKRDRVPAVSIGYAKKVLSGGASTNMLRYPTTSGQARQSWAPFTETRWIDDAKGYKPKAMDEWGDALESIVRKWNRG